MAKFLAGLSRIVAVPNRRFSVTGPVIPGLPCAPLTGTGRPIRALELLTRRMSISPDHNRAAGGLPLRATYVTDKSTPS